jgi:hypothetical protein
MARDDEDPQEDDWDDGDDDDSPPEELPCPTCGHSIYEETERCPH